MWRKYKKYRHIKKFYAIFWHEFSLIGRVSQTKYII
jgi:hypothetical protein